MKEPPKKFYKAISGGLIFRIGTTDFHAKKDHVYEWGEEEARPYLTNAPDNFIECNKDGKPIKAKENKEVTDTAKETAATHKYSQKTGKEK